MKCHVILSAALVIGLTSVASAINYDFLPVTSTGATTSQFNSLNGNGFINVTDTFSPGGAGAFDNVNTAIYPSQFTTLFPGTGLVQGHLGMTVYNHTAVFTFDLTNYTITPQTKFGMWNTTNEVTAPIGGNPVYRIDHL